MVFYGPRPSDELLLELSQEMNADMRAKAVQLMFQCTSKECRERLIAALEDRDPRVRRLACESLTRGGLPTTPEAHVRLLSDKDRFVAFAARRSLEQLPTSLWAHLVLEDADAQGFCQGAVALLACRRDAETAREVLARCQALLSAKEPLRASQQIDLLRVTQLALIHGELTAADAPELGVPLLARYPSGNALVDRELVQLLVYLQVDGAAKKFAAQLESNLPVEENMHLGAYAAKLETGWDKDSKLELMKFYEAARAVSGGYSVSAYVENFARDFFAKLSLAERRHILASGERWPASALSVLAKLPATPDAELLAELRGLDGRVRPLCANDDKYRRLRVGILAVLGRSGEDLSLEYLRTVYRDEPEQRDPVAMSLTQHPEGESWPYLVESLKTVDGSVAREVVTALATVPQRPREPEPYRQVILLGLRLGDEGADKAIQLLNHWSGQPSDEAPENYENQLARWQAWYAENFPSAPPAELPADSGQDKWSYEELLTYLESNTASGDPRRGEQAFVTAQCIKCHRCGAVGEILGPDLTTVAKRFQNKEILESIVYPSHIISDQYASRTVLANGRAYTGLVTPRGDEGVSVLTSDGQKFDLAHEDIEQISPSAVSSMPAGLLNSLTLEQVADLFAFLEQEHRPDVAAKQQSGNR
jgi:putative heme-binding domain-containing protein